MEILNLKSDIYMVTINQLIQIKLDGFYKKAKFFYRLFFSYIKFKFNILFKKI